MAAPLIWLEVVLGTVPVAWGVWELLSLRREQHRDAQRQRAQAAVQQQAAQVPSAGAPAAPAATAVTGVQNASGRDPPDHD